MFYKITFILAFFVIATLHSYLLQSIKLEEDKVVAAPSSNHTIALKKIILKPQKKVEKVIKKVVIKAKKKPKLVEKAVRKVIKEKKKEPKKIVKKAQPEIKKLVAAPTKPVAKKPTLTTAQKAAIENEYLQKLKAHIEKYKFYPKRAKRLRQQGSVKVSFVLNKNGQINSVKIIKKCPFKRLNKATIELFDKMTHFQPIPKELNKTSWELKVPITYNIANI